MIYAIIPVILFGIFIIIKEKGPSRYFLFTLILGWVTSIIGFASYLYYLQSRELYLYKFSEIFKPTFKLWGNENFFQIDVLTSITLIVFGTLCFTYSCICFSISLTKSTRSGNKIYFILAVLPVLEFIIYSPHTYTAFYYWYFNGKSLQSSAFQTLLDLEPKIYTITLFINCIYLASSVAIIIYYFFKTPAMKHFRQYILTVLLGFSANIITFITVFWWAPKRLVSASVTTGYTHILPVFLFWKGKTLFLFPYVSFISCIIILIALYKYNYSYVEMKQTSRLIVKAFDTAGLGTGMIAHDFKSYIMATIVDTEFLKDKYENDQESLEYINRVLNINYEFMKKLNDLSGKFKNLSLHIQSCDLKQIFYEVINTSNLDGIKLTITESPEPIMTLIDSKYIKEIFSNIIKNAIEAMEFTEKTLKIDLYGKKSHWSVITITDSGCGMNKDQIEKLFNPFFSTKSTSKNWGVGLTYCYKIIHAHKGKIYVESKKEKGATFKIFLPGA